MTFGSLFAGIGGFDLGFERAGLTCKWQVEIDPFCQRVLAKHWPHVQRFDDVRTVGAPDLTPVDVLCGGFPCQDISLAGKGAGLSGARSGLWREMLRAIRVVRPAYTVVENVAALLVRGMGTVLGDLAESGYDAEWDCLPASAFSAPHRRDRVWLVAYPECAERGTVGRARHRVERAHGLPPWEKGSSGAGGSGADVANAESGARLGWPSREGGHVARAQQRSVFPARAEFASAECRDWWATEPDVGRMAHGVPARVDRLRGLGNAIVPQIAEWIGRRLMEATA